MIATALFTFFALPAFLLNDRIDWALALPLAVGFAFGGWIGARINVAAGARVVRPVMIVAVLALSGRLSLLTLIRRLITLLHNIHQFLYK